MGSVLFQTKAEAHIEFIKSIFFTESNDKRTEYNIYKYSKPGSDCDKIFTAQSEIQYIGYEEDNTFHVVDLVNDIFIDQDDIKDKIDEIAPSLFSTINKDVMKARKELYRIPNFMRVLYNGPNCFNPIDLEMAKAQIDILNKQLKCIDYEITIDYLTNMNSVTEITAFSRNMNDIVLCISHNDKCISSLQIRKYDDDDDAIDFDSRTKKDDEGKDLNKLLIAILIIIAKSLFADAKYVKSEAVIATSAYIMLKYFKATEYKYDFLTEYGYDNTLTDDEKKTILEKIFLPTAKGVLLTKVELNDVNIRNAQSVFDDIVTINKMDCKKIAEGTTSGGWNRKTRCGRKRNKKTNKIIRNRKNRKTKGLQSRSR